MAARTQLVVGLVMGQMTIVEQARHSAQIVEELSAMGQKLCQSLQNRSQSQRRRALISVAMVVVHRTAAVLVIQLMTIVVQVNRSAPSVEVSFVTPRARPRKKNKNPMALIVAMERVTRHAVDRVMDLTIIAAKVNRTVQIAAELPAHLRARAVAAKK